MDDNKEDYNSGGDNDNVVKTMTTITMLVKHLLITMTMTTTKHLLMQASWVGVI